MTPQLSIGIGCSSRASSDDVLDLIRTCVKEVIPGTILATIDSQARMGETVAASLSMPLMLFSASTLAQVHGVTHHSLIAMEKSGTASVAEAAALMALGPHARLSLPRRTGQFCTCAVAVSP